MLSIDPQYFINAGYCFLRVGGVLFALPLFGDEVVPGRVRLFLTVAISYFILANFQSSWAPDFRDDALWFALSVIRELIIGLVIGYTAKLMFEGIVMAANLVGYQMGFGTGSLLLGSGEGEMTSFTALHRILILLIFLSLNFHHTFISAIVRTFELIPAGTAIPSNSLTSTMVTATSAIFVTAMELAAPIFVAMLFTMVALGLIARTVPQLNVFVLSFPLSFFIGLGIYVASTPYFIQWIRTYFATLDEVLMKSIIGLIAR